jgi:hypothetical protein
MLSVSLCAAAPTAQIKAQVLQDAPLLSCLPMLCAPQSHTVDRRFRLASISTSFCAQHRASRPAMKLVRQDGA